jgi:hypothetical protein
LSQGINIRSFQKSDSGKVIEFISGIIVNEFKFKLELILWILTYLQLTKVITSLMEVASGLQKQLLMMIIPIANKKQKILGTTAVRNLKQFESTCELKRIYVLRDLDN